MKYLKKFIIVSFLLLVIRVIFPFLDLYPYLLTKDYFLIGYGFNRYCIKDGYFGKILVTSMEKDSEWMIDSNYIYGHKGNIFNLTDDYFLVNCKNDSVIFFEDLSDLNNYLRDKNLKPFNMTDCESVLHLRINKRKYKL